jgi:hypothetical protein
MPSLSLLPRLAMAWPRGGRGFLGAALAAASALAPGTARADAIDGDWCFATQNLNIQGPKIRLPSGMEINGDYDRHGFRYVVPANENGAGTAVSMQLFGEELMQLTRGSAQPEMWRRCKPTS